MPVSASSAIQARMSAYAAISSAASATACSRDGGGIWSTPVFVSLPVCGLARQAVNAARNERWAMLHPVGIVLVGQAVKDVAYVVPQIAENTGHFSPGSSPPFT